MKASYGNFDSLGGRFRVDTGLLGSSGIKATFAVQHRQNDGYTDNIFVPGNRDHGASKSDALWGKIVAELGSFKATISGDYSDMRAIPLLQQGFAINPPLAAFFNSSPTGTVATTGANGSGAIYQVQPSYSRRTSKDVPQYVQRIKSRGISLTLEQELSSALKLKSISAARGCKAARRRGQMA